MIFFFLSPQVSTPLPWSASSQDTVMFHCSLWQERNTHTLGCLFTSPWPIVGEEGSLTNEASLYGRPEKAGTTQPSGTWVSEQWTRSLRLLLQCWEKPLIWGQTCRWENFDHLKIPSLLVIVYQPWGRWVLGLSAFSIFHYYHFSSNSNNSTTAEKLTPSWKKTDSSAAALAFDYVCV